MLLEIHMLQNHAPSNLNRDDTGSPKDCIFGGIRRSRISSQCLKRSIRTSPVFEEEMADIGLGVRTRLLPTIVKEALIKDGVDDELADIAAKKTSGFGTKSGKERDELRTAQIMFFSKEEIEAVKDLLKDEIEEAKTKEKVEKLDAKKLQKKLQKTFEEEGITPITPDVALFGRMITSAAFNDIEASMQVAHAISTNKMDQEFDFFTAVDDVKGYAEAMEEQGAGMMGDIEFNSACYYKYFSLDTDGFLANVMGGQEPAAAHEEVLLKTMKAFLQGAIFTTPSGKQNTFAAHQLPACILVEAREKKTPVSYANAFVSPARAAGKKDLVQDSMEKLVSHVDLITKKYSLGSKSRLWFSISEEPAPEGVTTCETVEDLLDGLEKAIQGD